MLALFVAVALWLALAGPVHAHCGDVSGDESLTASDALTILKRAVGQSVELSCSCGDCETSATTPAARAHCADVNGDGNVTAADALATLKSAVGQAVELACSCVGCQTDCPPEDALDDRTFNEIYTCDQSFGGGPRSCADLNKDDSIRFTHTDNGVYEVRDEPDTGFIYNGTLDCYDFDWDALSPGQYTESGLWTFSSDLESFSGSSTYTSITPGQYEGDCNTTGAEEPATPPNPPPPPACD